jgi:outer membrane receptor protein involved in Fe transport
MFASAPAFAQAASEPVEAQPDLEEEAPSADSGEIVVTGSRISRPNLEQSSPVQVVSEEEISFAQPQSAEEFLRDLPGSTAGQNAQVNNGNSGIATLNLRNLGTNRNLVLLNERRVTPSNLAANADLNVIPVALIERVDVFTGGASTVYGADAVAGVINFITKRNFSGVDISGNYGITSRGDGANYRVDLTTGANVAEGRGNVVVSLNFTKADPVVAGERSFGQVARSSATGGEQGSPTAAPATIQTPLFFDPVTGLSLGDTRVDPATGTFVLGAANYNFLPITIVQTPYERSGLYAQGRFEISSAVEVYAQGQYTRTSVTQRNAPSGSFFQPLFIPLNSPFLTTAQRNTICLAQDNDPATAGRQAPTQAQCDARIAAGQEVQLSIGRRFVEAGPRVTDLRSNTYEIIAGARGPLTSTLDWDISGQTGRADRVNRTTGSGLLSRLQEAVRGCPTGSTTGCTPINLFGAEGSITPAQVAFLDVPLFAFINTQFDAAQAVINGDLGFASPFANEAIGIATGVEYRRYAGNSRGDLPSSTSGAVLGAGAPSLPIAGKYDTKEAFAEIIVPLIEDRPFFHNLTVEAGGRYSDYSTSGGNWTYKVGGSYMPVRDIKVRGVYSRAVRAPNLGELFQPQVTFLTARTTDPCQGTAAQIAARGANVEVCRAATGNNFGAVPAPAAGQINATTGGNPLLDPEIATTFTAGVVLQPSFARNLAVTLDYYDIKVKEAISNPTATDIIDACYVGNTNPSSPQCLAIGRNPVNGSLSGPNNTTSGPFLGLSNLGRIRSSGFDLGATYRQDLGFGRLNLSLIANRTTRFLFQPTPTSLNRDCLGFFSPACGAPTPKFSFNQRSTLSLGQTDISLLWRHISKARVEPPAPTPQVPVGEPGNAGPTTFFGPYSRIPAYNYFDLALQQSIARNLRLTLTVNNLLDKDPPFVGGQAGGSDINSSATNTFPVAYDPIGRRFVLGANLRF